MRKSLGKRPASANPPATPHGRTNSFTTASALVLSSAPADHTSSAVTAATATAPSADFSPNSFATASALVRSSAPDHASSAVTAATANRMIIAATQDSPTAASTFSFSLTVVGVQHQPARIDAPEGCVVTLVRQHDNPVDDKAIAVCVLPSELQAAGGARPFAKLSADRSLGAYSHPTDEDGMSSLPSLPSPSSPIPLGHLAWFQARELAPVLDSGLATVTDAEVTSARRTSDGERVVEYHVKASFLASGHAADLLAAADRLHGRYLIEITEMSHEIAKRDADSASGHANRLLSCDVRAWDPAAKWPAAPPSAAPARVAKDSTSALNMHDDVPTDVLGGGDATPPPAEQFEAPTFPNEFTLCWRPFAPEAVERKPSLARADVETAQATGWPPSDSALLSLGLGPASDPEWWGAHGLKPPIAWDLQGAIDLLPGIRGQTQANGKRASDVLDGGAHACVPWLDETLEAMDALMHEPNFWCKRNGDAFIRSYGGPYVLGQDEGKLKLIHGAPHTPLTSLVCRGHTLVYTACHLELPPAPGYNTLIFGLNLRAAGFYFHQVRVLASAWTAPFAVTIAPTA